MVSYLVLAAKSYFSNYEGLPKACWEGIFLTFIGTTSIGVCFFLSLYFVNNLHIDIATAGVLISCYGFGTAMGGIIGGKLTDKFSPKMVSIVSLLIESFAFIALIKFKTIYLIMLNLFLLGVAAYSFKTSNNVWILSQCKDLTSIRLKAINILYAASNLGLGLSGIIISLFAHYGFEYIFFLSGMLLLFAAICLIFQNRENLSNQENNQNEVIKTVDNPTSENKKIVFLVLTCLFLMGLVIAQLSATYPVYIHESFPHLGAKAVGILFTLDSVLIVLFQTPLVNFFHDANKVLMVGVGGFLMGFGMLLLSFATAFYLAIISCIFWTTGEMIFISMAQLVCYEKGSVKKKGQNLGLFQTIFASSIIVGPTLGGFIYHQFGGNMLWYLCAMTGSLCLLICLFPQNIFRFNTNTTS